MSKPSLKSLRKTVSKRLVGLLLVLLLAYLQSAYPLLLKDPNAPPAGYYTVASIVDGDTIVVLMNGSEESVRFIGVDTPETRDPRKPVQCFGRAASLFTKELIADNPVRLETDPLSSSQDHYNRLLRYIYLPDGTLVQAEIIKQGYGFAYTSFPFTKSEEFSSLQREAREQERGLWSSCELTENNFGGLNTHPE